MPQTRISRIFTNAVKTFNSEYKNELNSLLGMSKDEIDSITPDTTDLEKYYVLIKVVEDASKNNLKQAELIENIKKAGEIAIKIAKKVPRFAALL